MNKLALGGILVFIVAIVGGLILYQATAPDIGDDKLQEAAEQSDKSGLFYQMKPDSAPPAKDLDNEEENTEIKQKTSENIPAPPIGGDPDILLSAPIENEPTETNVVAQFVESVSITDTGFIPDSVTIAPDTTISFINNGQAPHWPASDSHPTHDILPGFDAKRGLETGEEYLYTFTEIGEWTYHDHLNPGLVGSIIVK